MVEKNGSGSAEVRQTDEHGKITAWDTYESFSGAVQWTCAERLRAVGRGVVRFGMDEIKTIREAVSSGTGCRFPESIEGRLSALSSEIRKGLLAAAAAHGMVAESGIKCKGKMNGHFARPCILFRILLVGS